MAEHCDLGLWGELVAIDYLKSKGYFVCHHDWKFNHKDLDIVAIDNATKDIVFVEVKTRRDNVFAEPEDAVDYRKIANLKSAAMAYIEFFKIERNARFDVISIIGTTDDDYTLRHIVDAF